MVTSLNRHQERHPSKRGSSFKADPSKNDRYIKFITCRSEAEKLKNHMAITNEVIRTYHIDYTNRTFNIGHINLKVDIVHKIHMPHANRTSYISVTR